MQHKETKVFLKYTAWIMILAAFVLGVSFPSNLAKFSGTMKYIAQAQISQQCNAPVIYTIGRVDPAFKMSKDQFLADIKQAGDVWAKAAGEPLFSYATSTNSDSSVVEINLIYDWRQASVDKANDLGASLDAQQADYDSGRSQYNAMVAQYKSDKNDLDNLHEIYDRNNSTVASSTTQLQLSNQITEKTTAINELIDKINSKADELNRLADNINLQADQYNAVVSQISQGFGEGDYTVNDTGSYINVYEFESNDQLVRLLAHELGHSLGLDHTDNSSDIMYAVNEKTAPTISVNDIAQLKSVCGL